MVIQFFGMEHGEQIFMIEVKNFSSVRDMLFKVDEIFLNHPDADAIRAKITIKKYERNLIFER